MVRVFKRTGNKGASLVELMVAMGIMVGAAMAVSFISGAVSEMAVERRLASRMATVSKIVQDVVRFGGTCQIALVDTPLGAFVLPNVTGLNVDVTTPATLNTAFDAPTSHPLRLYIPGIAPGQDYIADPALPGATDSGWTVLLNQELFIDKLQVVNLMRIGATEEAGQSDFVGLLKMRVQGRRINGERRGPSRDLTVGSLLFRAEDGAGAGVPGRIVRCLGITTQGPQDFCENLGCEWNEAATPQCSCNETHIGCEPGEVLVGFNEGSGPDCRPLGGQCPPNHYAIGAEIDRAICVRAPSCTAEIGALSWYGTGAESDSFCLNTLAYGPILSGDEVTVQASAAANAPNYNSGDGQATFQCLGGIWSAPYNVSCTYVAPPTPTITPTPPPVTSTPPTPTPCDPNYLDATGYCCSRPYWQMFQCPDTGLFYCLEATCLAGCPLTQAICFE